MKAAIVSLNEEHRNRRFPVDNNFRIGRSEDNDLVLDRKYISRRHAVINEVNGHFVIKDLGSRNPTLINNQPVQEHQLRHGDAIVICDFQFRFVQEQNVQSQPQPQLNPQNDQVEEDGTSFVDMSRYVQEAPKDELSSIGQIQLGSGVMVEESDEISVPPIGQQPQARQQQPPTPTPQPQSGVSSPRTTTYPPQNPGGQQPPQSPSPLQYQPIQSNPPQPPQIEEESDFVPLEPVGLDEASEIEPIDLGSGGNLGLNLEDDDEEIIEIEEDEFDSPPLMGADNFAADTFTESPGMAGPQSGQPMEISDADLSFEPMDDDDEIDMIDLEEEDAPGDGSREITPDEYDENELNAPRTQLPGEKPPPAQLLRPEDDDEVELEGTAVVDLGSVLTEMPAELKEQLNEAKEEEPEEKPSKRSKSFTGSLADLMANQKPTATAPPEDDEDSDDDIPTPSGKKSSIIISSPELQGDVDDEDEGTDVVEIQVGVEDDENDEDDDDEGTDIHTLPGQKPAVAGGDETAQLDAVTSRRGKSGKLADADAISISADAEEEEDEDEYYIDPEGTGSFNVQDFMEKKNAEKRMEPVMYLAALVFTVVVFIIMVSLFKNDPVTIVPHQKVLVAGKNEVLELNYDRTNRLVKPIGTGKNKFVVANNKYIKITHVLVSKIPTFFILEPKKATKEIQKFEVVYKNGSKEIFHLKISPGKKEVPIEEEVKQLVSKWNKDTRKVQQQKWIEVANAFWDERKIDGNEANYSKAIKLYQKAYYTILSYKPTEFDNEWREERETAKNLLNRAIDEQKRTLKIFEKEFRGAYKAKKKDKAIRKIIQIINLINDPNDIKQMKYQIYKDHLY